MSVRKICVVTTSRAEYGLLFWLMREIQNDPALELQIIASGTHLAPEFGNSYQLIEADGFQINEMLDCLLASDSAAACAKTLGLTCISFTDAFERLQPDVVVVLGDRYEILGVAQAAMMLKIPLAHIHGGELTTGALDDSIRHAITKLANIHFPVAGIYARRIAQLGEDPDKIFNFGAPGLDHITRTPLWPKAELEANLGLKFAMRNFLVVYHPVTTKKDPVAGLYPLLAALEQYPDVQLIFSKSNADEGGRRINLLIDEFVMRHSERAKAFSVLGLPRYLSVAKCCDLVIGNSSSGLIEIPAIGVPTINIGERESGRLKASSVINCAENQEAIVSAIETVFLAEFQHSLQNIQHPYGAGNASVRIKDVLKNIDLSNITVKPFFDVALEKGVMV